MSLPDRCPRCGSDDLHPRALPANQDRGAIEELICSACGEVVGPVLVPDADPTPAVPETARAAKLFAFPVFPAAVSRAAKLAVAGSSAANLSARSLHAPLSMVALNHGAFAKCRRSLAETTS